MSKTAFLLLSFPLYRIMLFPLSFITTRPSLLYGCISKLFFIIGFAHFNVRSMWAVVALFTSVLESLEQCLNIAGPQKLLFMNHNDDDDSSGTLSSSGQCHHGGVSTLTRGGKWTPVLLTKVQDVWKLFLLSPEEMFSFVYHIERVEF